MIALVTLGFVGAFQEEITRIGASVLIGGLVALNGKSGPRPRASAR